MFRHIVILGWALALIGFQAEATTVVVFPFDTLCQQAKTIAYVRCETSESFQTQDGIFTRTRLKVLQPVKGDGQTEIVLTLPGGKVGENRLVVYGMPRFAAGQEMVVFLSEPDAQGSPWPMGLGQGCYGVQEGEDGAKHVRMHPGVTPIPQTIRTKPIPGQALQVSLQNFIGQVHQVLKPEGQD